MISGEKVAVVTGAASGMGRAFAGRLASDGAAVAVVDLNPVDEVVHEIATRTGSTARGYECDVSDPDAVARTAAAILADFGRADVLVNAAGIFPQADFADTDHALWQRVLAVNLTSMFLTCQAFLPGMVERQHGRIINVSSRTFFIPSAGYSAYIAAKAGVIGLTRALATEYGPAGVTANVIAPGLIRTAGVQATIEPERFEALASRQPVNRVGEAGDVVSAVSFFAADDSGFITGQTLVVDGGLVRL